MTYAFRSAPRGARSGFSLIEIALAVAVGLMVLGATVFAFNQVNASSKMANTKTIVGTVQGNIAMDKFRIGSPPPRTPVPGATPVLGVSINTDYTGTAYYPQASPGAMPNDPVTGYNDVLPYDSTATAVPLVAGAPTPQWDNPVFLSPGPTPGYGKGGWLYDEATGSFRANLSNQDYPDQRPASW